MPTSLASSLVWDQGNSPTIYLDLSYDASRSGANMLYTVYLTVRKPSGTFGYPIYATVSLDGTQVYSTTILAVVHPVTKHGHISCLYLRQVQVYQHLMVHLVHRKQSQLQNKIRHLPIL